MTNTYGLESFARSMLRGAGWGCVLNIEAHFDESGTDAPELTLAGYIFEADRIDRFCATWNELLRQHNLPYFHMVDLAHGNPPFENMKRSDRVQLQMKFMRLVKRYAVNGIVCNISNVRDNSGSSYLTVVQEALKQAVDWADRVSFEGRIAYYFEAGANGQGLVDSHFQEIATDAAASASHRYAGYAFVPKEGNPGVQAADLLAWQYHNFTKKRSTNDLARLDLRALLRHPHHISDQCGDPPRESVTQSPHESRRRLETVYYLPISKGGGTVLAPSKDFVPVKGQRPGHILACPNCFRAVMEDCSISNFIAMAVKCYCGTVCDIPSVMVPFARGSIASPR